MQRATTFYEKVFVGELQKLECVGLEEMMAFPMQENGTGSMGALVKRDGCPSGGNSTLVYFTCDDCAVEATRAKENGGQIFREKFAIGQYGFISIVSDTEGNMIGLHSMQ